MTPEELQLEIQRLAPWHYNHVFPGGLSTGDSGKEEVHPKLVQLVEAGAFSRPMYQKVLDLGANSGLISMWFADHRRSEVVAIEGNPRYFQQLQLAITVKGYESTITPIQKDITQGDYGERIYDLVLHLGLLHHLQSDYHLPVLKNCFKALIPGGEIVVQTQDTLPVAKLLAEVGFVGVERLSTHWHDRAAWRAMRDPMKLW